MEWPAGATAPTPIWGNQMPSQNCRFVPSLGRLGLAAVIAASLGIASTRDAKAQDSTQKPYTIKDGKVDGKTITFTVTLDFGGMPFTIAYKGEVTAEQIKMQGDAAGMPFELVLKKAK